MDRSESQPTSLVCHRNMSPYYWKQACSSPQHQYTQDDPHRSCQSQLANANDLAELCPQHFAASDHCFVRVCMCTTLRNRDSSFYAKHFRRQVPTSSSGLLFRSRESCVYLPHACLPHRRRQAYVGRRGGGIARRSDTVLKRSYCKPKQLVPQGGMFVRSVRKTSCQSHSPNASALVKAITCLVHNTKITRTLHPPSVHLVCDPRRLYQPFVPLTSHLRTFLRVVVLVPRKKRTSTVACTNTIATRFPRDGSNTFTSHHAALSLLKQGHNGLGYIHYSRWPEQKNEDFTSPPPPCVPIETKAEWRETYRLQHVNYPCHERACARAKKMVNDPRLVPRTEFRRSALSTGRKSRGRSFMLDMNQSAQQRVHLHRAFAASSQVNSPT